MNKVKRLKLHNELLKIVPKPYFKPPEGSKMEYPCIVYKYTNLDTEYANNRPYAHKDYYTLTVIETNPDGEISLAVRDLPRVKYVTSFTKSGLYHTVFIIQY